MTPERLDELEARCQAATNGPWVVVEQRHVLNELGERTFPEGVCSAPDSERGNFTIDHSIATSWDHPQLEGPVGIVLTARSPYFDPDAWSTMTAENADFIAHAREDLPLLLAALRAVTAERDEWRERAGLANDRADEWQAQYRDLEAERDALESACAVYRGALTLYADSARYKTDSRDPSGKPAAVSEMGRKARSVLKKVDAGCDLKASLKRMQATIDNQRETLRHLEHARSTWQSIAEQHERERDVLQRQLDRLNGAAIPRRGERWRDWPGELRQEPEPPDDEEFVPLPVQPRPKPVRVHEGE